MLEEEVSRSVDLLRPIDDPEIRNFVEHKTAIRLFQELPPDKQSFRESDSDYIYPTNNPELLDIYFQVQISDLANKHSISIVDTHVFQKEFDSLIGELVRELGFFEALQYLSLRLDRSIRFPRLDFFKLQVSRFASISNEFLDQIPNKSSVQLVEHVINNQMTYDDASNSFLCSVEENGRQIELALKPSAFDKLLIRLAEKRQIDSEDVWSCYLIEKSLTYQSRPTSLGSENPLLVYCLFSSPERFIARALLNQDRDSFSDGTLPVVLVRAAIEMRLSRKEMPQDLEDAVRVLLVRAKESIESYQNPQYTEISSELSELGFAIRNYKLTLESSASQTRPTLIKHLTRMSTLVKNSQWKNKETWTDPLDRATELLAKGRGQYNMMDVINIKESVQTSLEEVFPTARLRNPHIQPIFNYFDAVTAVIEADQGSIDFNPDYKFEQLSNSLKSIEERVRQADIQLSGSAQEIKDADDLESRVKQIAAEIPGTRENLDLHTDSLESLRILVLLIAGPDSKLYSELEETIQERNLFPGAPYRKLLDINNNLNTLIALAESNSDVLVSSETRLLRSSEAIKSINPLDVLLFAIRNSDHELFSRTKSKAVSFLKNLKNEYLFFSDSTELIADKLMLVVKLRQIAEYDQSIIDEVLDEATSNFWNDADKILLLIKNYDPYWYEELIKEKPELSPETKQSQISQKELANSQEVVQAFEQFKQFVRGLSYEQIKSSLADPSRANAYSVHEEFARTVAQRARIVFEGMKSVLAKMKNHESRNLLSEYLELLMDVREQDWPFYETTSVRKHRRSAVNHAIRQPLTDFLSELPKAIKIEWVKATAKVYNDRLIATADNSQYIIWEDILSGVDISEKADIFLWLDKSYRESESYLHSGFDQRLEPLLNELMSEDMLFKF